MRPLLDTNRLDECEVELGMPCEQLLTPLSSYRLARPGQPFAVDNGAFSGFDPHAFERRLAGLKPHRAQCRFVTVPDVIAAGMQAPKEPVGNAPLTLALFHDRAQVFPYLAGWPLAYVAQDGAEHLDVPWHAMAALFVGGSTRWKEGAGAAQLVRAAKIRGKWVHVGRVNGPERWRHFEGLGADSADGTGLITTTRQRVAIRQRHDSPAPLFAPARP